jgi:hypothetical protein
MLPCTQWGKELLDVDFWVVGGVVDQQQPLRVLLRQPAKNVANGRSSMCIAGDIFER